MIILLFLIGLAFIAFSHLIIPFCFARKGNTYPNKTLWLIALGGGLLGFVVCTMQEEFRGFLGILQSGFWTLVNYTILYRKCSEKKQETQQEDPQETQEKTEEEQNKG